MQRREVGVGEREVLHQVRMQHGVLFQGRGRGTCGAEKRGEGEEGGAVGVSMVGSVGGSWLCLCWGDRDGGRRRPTKIDDERR